jgi:hypothetical protein
VVVVEEEVEVEVEVLPLFVLLREVDSMGDSYSL